MLFAAARICWMLRWTPPETLWFHERYVGGWQVRQAFTADVSKGHTLIVADYGQLELRLLAHMADCASMKTAFELGGDFHSRTALGMYDNIKEAIAQGPPLSAFLPAVRQLMFIHLHPRP